MYRISFKNLQMFLLNRFGLETIYLHSMKCLLCKRDVLPVGLAIELSIRGFYFWKNISNNYLIYRKLNEFLFFYKTEEVNNDLTLSTRRDAVGDIWHVVEYSNNDGKSDYAFFEHLSSALDFIHSNFK